MNLVLCGLGGFFVAQAVKTVLRVRPWHKLVLALIGSAGVAAFVFEHHFSELAIYGVAGAGLAIVINRAARLLLLVGDLCIRRILDSRDR
jgi:hypothetical protein